MEVIAITEYAYPIDRKNGCSWKTYVARITGADPNYILQRDFKNVRFCRTYYGYSAYLMLPNGLYEVCISRFSDESGERTERERWWIIVVDNDIYEYEFEEINWQYALYTAFNVHLNCKTEHSMPA